MEMTPPRKTGCQSPAAQKKNRHEKVQENCRPRTARAAPETTGLRGLIAETL